MDAGILEQIRIARAHRAVAYVCGAGGGLFPVAGCAIVHFELRKQDGSWDFAQPLTPVALACLLYSVTTVWQWGRGSVGHSFKVACAVVGLEGMMAFSSLHALTVASLAFLVLINAISTACIVITKDTEKGESRADPGDEPAPPSEAELMASDAAPDTASAATRSQAVRRPRNIEDALYHRAVVLVRGAGKCSTSAIQRNLAIGYNTAAKLVERMEREGLVGPAAAGGRSLRGGEPRAAGTASAAS
ncbi:MAG TPA: DNA translocase FtsK [Polyangiales bacterium]|nr:DNA translocase FtsK [Polyangiales bacterium]